MVRQNGRSDAYGLLEASLPTDVMVMWQACKNAKKVTLLPVMCTREVGPHVVVWACL